VRDLVAHGMTAIAAIHDLPLAARYCHRLVLLSKGRVIADGPPQEVLTPANLESVFGVRAVVYQEPLTGALTVSLLDARPPDGHRLGSGRIHVICGGGSGSRLMYELQRAGFLVTTGVLGAGDTDRTAADIMGIEYVPVPAFSPIDNDSYQRHLWLVAQADVVALAPTPFGHNNLRNLEVATYAKRLISVEPEGFEGRDFAKGEATRLYQALRPVARCKTHDEAIESIASVLGKPM